MSTLTYIDDIERHIKRYVLEIDMTDLMFVNITGIDQMLIDECESSSKVSDKLLALELIVRRIEETKINELEAKEKQ